MTLYVVSSVTTCLCDQFYVTSVCVNNRGCLCPRVCVFEFKIILESRSNSRSSGSGIVVAVLVVVAVVAIVLVVAVLCILYFKLKVVTILTLHQD